MTSDGRRLRVWRFVRRAATILLVAAVVAAAAFFPHAGNYLVVNEPLERSDVVFSLAGGRDRWLEAIDLYSEGWAKHIVLSPGYHDRVIDKIRERGVRFPTEIELTKDAFRQLNVPPEAFTVLPHDVDNTAQEAQAIRKLMGERGWTRLILVTSKYHTRRARLAVRRELEGTPIQVIVRTSRYDPASPEQWWKNRGNVRYVAAEYQKLLLYAFGLRG